MRREKCANHMRQNGFASEQVDISSCLFRNSFRMDEVICIYHLRARTYELYEILVKAHDTTSREVLDMISVFESPSSLTAFSTKAFNFAIEKIITCSILKLIGSERNYTPPNHVFDNSLPK